MSATLANKIRGQVVYLFAYDVAYDMKRQPVELVLGHRVETYTIAGDKRGPREQFFYRPQMVRLPVVEATLSDRRVSLGRTLKIFPVGALSVCFSAPFEVDRLEDLVSFHDPRLGGVSLEGDARALVERVRTELGAFLIHPINPLREEEAYTIFCIEAPSLGLSAGEHGSEAWLAAHRRQVAGVLTQEPDPSRLSEQETLDTAGKYLSYYGHDLVVVDWDAALVIDEPGQFEPTLHVLELANVQLAEVEAYDRLLDEATERSYRDMRSAGLRANAAVLRGLREIRVDLSRLSDEMSNTTKFLGDWHLARVYQAISARFHLADWHRTIDEKLRTLDGLYQLIRQDMINRWMMILEATIVLLFIIEIIRVFWMEH